MFVGGFFLQLIFQPWTIRVDIDYQVIASVIIIIIFGTIIPFSIYLRGVVMAGANRAAMILNIEPLTAALLSAFWLGDKFHTMDIIGSICILSTIFILSSRAKEKDK